MAEICDNEVRRILRQLVTLRSVIADGYGGRTIENIVANLEARVKERTKNSKAYN